MTEETSLAERTATGRSWLARVCMALALALTPTGAWASEAPPSHWLGVPTWVWAWGNLIVFWGTLFYFVGPLLRSFLQRRREGIAADLENARRLRAEAAEMKTGLEAKLEELVADMDRLARRSEEEGEKEREQILELAKRESERASQQARDEIENRIAQSRIELTQWTANLAGELARGRAQERLTAQDRRRIFERNVDRLRDSVQEKAS